MKSVSNMKSVIYVGIYFEVKFLHYSYMSKLQSVGYNLYQKKFKKLITSKSDPDAKSIE